MLGKTFKGLTDAMLEWQTKELWHARLTVTSGPWYVRPELVVKSLSDLQRAVASGRPGTAARAVKR